MILTPEQIEAVLPELAKPLRQTLAAYAEIVERVAAIDPVVGVGLDGDTYVCACCVGDDHQGWWTPGAVEHKSDCPWLAARRLRGKA